jgi:signal transduction histidine kinase
VVSLQLHQLRRHLPSPTPDVEVLLDQLGEQVTRATDRLRALLFNLEPTTADAPISTSLRTQAAHIFDGSAIHWSVDDLDAGKELPAAERGQALRITREALQNAGAHARATEVVVSLRGDDQGLEIVVADNGVAADPAAFTSAAGHRGLSTMQDRAAAVGGWCTFERSLHTGCTVRIHIPHARVC